MRTSTIRHSAWLAWRSPPGLSRKRLEVLPDEAGIGATPAQVRPGDLGAEPFGMIPGGDEEDSGGVRVGAVDGEQARGVKRDEGDDELVEPVDLVGKELGAPSELA